MSKIIPKLNLNKNPQVVENNSLVFAKNIKLTKDLDITRDDGIKSIDKLNELLEYYDIVGVIPYNTEIYYFLYSKINADLDTEGNPSGAKPSPIDTKAIINIVYNNDIDSSKLIITSINEFSNDVDFVITLNNNIELTGHCDYVNKYEKELDFVINSINNFVITSNINEYEIKIQSSENIQEAKSKSIDLSSSNTRFSKIIKYNENNDTIEEIKCNWNYSGGIIDGTITNNLNSDTIITIAEWNGNKKIPIKFINTNICAKDDDESIYSQSPKIPILNLIFDNYYTNTIPNGVYQFFVRYEIKKDLYTNWFLCSNELYSTNSIKTDTIQGSVKYNDVTLDSTTSFILNVTHPDNIDLNEYNYKSFQIGFILSHDDTTVARSWKNFSLNTLQIYFDYDKDYIKEINIDDILADVYSIYNVKNLTNFKNKLYISNYEENNINPILRDYANKINIEIKTYKKREDIQYDTLTYYNDYFSYPTVYINNYYTYYNEYDTDVSFTKRKDTSNVIIPGLDWDFDLNLDFTMPIPTTGTIQINPEDKFGTKVIPFDKLYLYDYNITKSNIRGNDYTYTDWVYYGYYYGLFEQDGTPRSSYCEVYATITLYDDANNLLYSERKNINSGSLNDYNRNYISNAFNIINIISNLSDYVSYLGSQIHLKNQNRFTNYIKVQFDVTGNNVIIEKWNDYTTQRNPNAFKWQYDVLWRQKRQSYNHNVTFYYKANIKVNQLITKTQDDYTNISTLIPYKSYNFYIHYVKENGEHTNGYLINDQPVTIDFHENEVIYPAFSNIEIPSEYSCCFISISDVGNIVSQIFRNNNYPNNIWDCLDIDTLLIPIYNNINAIAKYDSNEIKLKNGKYLSSGIIDKDNLSYFGASGKIVFSKIEGEFNNNIDKGFIIINRNRNTEIENLIKCTPYFSSSIYDNPIGLNCLGYMCYICKPTFGETNYFISGSDVYEKYIENDNISLNNKTSYATIANTPMFTIYSEYNLNALSLTSDLNNSIRSYKDGGNATKYQLIKSYNSLVLNDIYNLPSMYKDYTRKLFNKYTDDFIINFDNTIRESDVLSDEGRNYKYNFNALQYYNIPVTKGKITNLKSIADKILVHTEDSLFVFSGSQKLTTQEGNAQLSESDPFDTGITELFGSERGFVGLKDKRHSMLSYDGYIFYDKDCNTIYNYNGQGLVPISDVIQKLLNYDKIDDIIFANDYYNDRFLMLIKFNNNKTVNLSFNFKTKTFVSIHDFSFDKSFSTKSKCYFLKNNKIYNIDKNVAGYNELTIYDTLYPYVNDDTNKKCIIDIIYNNNYEQLKTLNSISWIGNLIINSFRDFITETGFDNITTNMADDEDRDINFINAIQVYSDTCLTPLLTIQDKDSLDYCLHASLLKDIDDKFINPKRDSSLDLKNYPNIHALNANSYKYPVYNNGVWNYNYLFNKLNKEVSGVTSDYKIIGKYFVVRFIINNGINFKLSNTIFNIQ